MRLVLQFESKTLNPNIIFGLHHIPIWLQSNKEPLNDIASTAREYLFP